MQRGIVFDIKKFSLHDGPGIRTTVFLKGCGLRCWWCHNPESQFPQPELLLRPELCIQCGACLDECPQAAITQDSGGFVTNRDVCTRCGSCVDACYADAREIVGRTMTIADVMTEVLRDLPFYDESGGGVTFSGGEPLLQGEFLLALLKACRAQGLHTIVDTCGHAPTRTLDAVREYVDLFLYDLKVMDNDRHRAVTGVPNDLILRNLRRLSDNGHRVIVRVPVIPNINDDHDNLAQIAALVKSLPAVERVDILPYHRIGSDKYARLHRPNPMPDTDPPSEEHMVAIQTLLQGFGLRVTIGG